jgi:hypothetical protein
MQHNSELKQKVRNIIYNKEHYYHDTLSSDISGRKLYVDGTKLSETIIDKFGKVHRQCQHNGVISLVYHINPKKKRLKVCTFHDYYGFKHVTCLNYKKCKYDGKYYIDGWQQINEDDVICLLKVDYAQRPICHKCRPWRDSFTSHVQQPVICHHCCYSWPDFIKITHKSRQVPIDLHKISDPETKPEDIARILTDHEFIPKAPKVPKEIDIYI